MGGHRHRADSTLELRLTKSARTLGTSGRIEARLGSDYAELRFAWSNATMVCRIFESSFQMRKPAPIEPTLTRQNPVQTEEIKTPRPGRGHGLGGPCGRGPIGARHGPVALAAC